jgi:hypothetical protein
MPLDSTTASLNVDTLQTTKYYAEPAILRKTSSIYMSYTKRRRL